MTRGVPLYDAFGADYDAMVSWPDRLARESPFLTKALESVGARRIIDLGSATGHHSLHFARQGYDVVGVDPSEEMVRLARAQAGDSNVSFLVGGFGGLRASLEGEFDAVLCLGNTLPHVPDQASLQSALADIMAVLRPGGLLIVQQLNYDRIMTTRQRFLGLSQGRRDHAEYLFFRFYDYLPTGLAFNVVIMRREADGTWQHRVESTYLQPILSTQLTSTLAETGFVDVRLYANYDGEAFSPLSANDLILTAKTPS